METKAQMSKPEVWLRGPLPDYLPVLMPAAHALLQAREDIERVAAQAGADELWRRPGDAATAGYHLQHLAGSLDRLLTYARGEPLDETQRAALLQEGTGDAPGSALVPAALAQIDRALEQLRRTPAEALEAPREVGRARLPSTVLGLLVHAAEHTSRHVGQLITTLKIVRGSADGSTANAARNKAVSKRWHEAWGTSGIVAAYRECLAADFTADFFGQGRVDRATYIARDQEFASGFSDAGITVEEMVAEDDRVMARMTWRGRHTGTILGTPATGRRFEVAGFAVDRFRDGQVIEHVPVIDQLALLRQLGLDPAKAGRV